MPFTSLRALRNLVASGALALGSVALAAPAAAHDPLAPRNDGKLRFEFHARMRGGLTDGNLQTPRGGAAGSTTIGRPTLDELNIKDALAPGVRLRILYDRHRLVADFEQIHLHGTGTLAQDLVTQRDPYPAGTRVTSSTFLDRGTLSYRHAFPICLSNGGRLELTPGLGYSVFGFRYRLKGNNGQTAYRVYTDYVPHLDLGIRWRPWRASAIWFSGEARQSLVFLQKNGKNTDLFEAFVRMHYDFNESWGAFVGIGYQHMFKKDGQPTPNKPHVDFGPFLELGVSVRF